VEQEKIKLRELVKRAKQNDSEALAQIYDLFVEKVYRYIFYKVGNQAEAEDLTEEVFLKVLENIERFEERGAPFSSWLFVIARNLVINYYKLRSRQAAIPLNLLKEQIADNERPDEAFFKNFSAEKLQIAIAQLTEEQQQVIILKFFSGLKNREIAGVLSKSEGAVKALQHRALASLYRILRGVLKE
jgi:RNA polymerase sigma-70 factor (ECF subfamily)